MLIVSYVYLYSLNETVADSGESKGSGPLLKLVEQKVVRKGRFCCKAPKYAPKMSYFALKSSKVVSFPGLRLPLLLAAGGSAPGSPLLKFLDPPL